jgi:hypothetical protein
MWVICNCHQQIPHAGVSAAAAVCRYTVWDKINVTAQPSNGKGSLFSCLCLFAAVALGCCRYQAVCKARTAQGSQWQVSGCRKQQQDKLGVATHDAMLLLLLPCKAA